MATATAPKSTPTPDNRGLLRTGSLLPDGRTIAAVSLTAYLLNDGDATEWVSFDRVHGKPAPVMPLVVLR